MVVYEPPMIPVGYVRLEVERVSPDSWRVALATGERWRITNDLDSTVYNELTTAEALDVVCAIAETLLLAPE